MRGCTDWENWAQCSVCRGMSIITHEETPLAGMDSADEWTLRILMHPTRGWSCGRENNSNLDDSGVCGGRVRRVLFRIFLHVQEQVPLRHEPFDNDAAWRADGQAGRVPPQSGAVVRHRRHARTVPSKSDCAD